MSDLGPPPFERKMYQDNDPYAPIDDQNDPRRRFPPGVMTPPAFPPLGGQIGGGPLGVGATQGAGARQEVGLESPVSPEAPPAPYVGSGGGIPLGGGRSYQMPAQGPAPAPQPEQAMQNEKPSAPALGQGGGVGSPAPALGNAGLSAPLGGGAINSLNAAPAASAGAGMTPRRYKHTGDGAGMFQGMNGRHRQGGGAGF
jgi:hypothetical protein